MPVTAETIRRIGKTAKLNTEAAGSLGAIRAFAGGGNIHLEIALSENPADLLKLEVRTSVSEPVRITIFSKAASEAESEQAEAAAELLMLLLVGWNIDGNGAPLLLTLESLGALGLKTLVRLLSEVRPYVRDNGEGLAVKLAAKTLINCYVRRMAAGAGPGHPPEAA